MGLDLGRIKARQNETTKGSSGNRYKPVDGKPNRVRVFAFTHKVTQADVKAGYYGKDKLGKVVTEIDRPVTIHFNVGANNRPVLSTPALMKRWNDAKSSDPNLAKSIQPSTKYALNIIDTEDKERTMRNWMCPKSVYNEILGCVLDPDYGEAILGAKGRDFVVIYDNKLEGSDKYSVKVRDKDKCASLNSSLNEKVVDFYSSEGFASLGILVESTPVADEEEAASEDDEKSEEDEDLKGKGNESEEEESSDDEGEKDEGEKDEEESSEESEEEVNDEDLKDEEESEESEEDEKKDKKKDKDKKKKKK